MFYDRKIKYFDYIENGQRLRNGGFVKLEVRDDNCCMTLQISVLRTMEHCNCNVYLLSGERREILCEIPLCQGRGSVQLNARRQNLCGGISYGQLEEIQIPVSAGRELRCIIAETRDCQEPAEQKAAEQEIIKDVEQETILDAEQSAGEEVEQEIIKDVEKCDGEEKIQKNQKFPLLEDKWKQLSAVYPHITPFQDDREYLSIGPGDFVILSQKSYRLVHNSFLLHGFYNYKHLILTCMETMGEKRYYIGVPGNFYEREKQVALMFGFENFECREEPAGAGDFGYYMIRVEL